VSSFSRELFDAARQDAPGADLHEAMWNRVADATGAAGAAGAPAATTKTVALGGAKLVALGGVIGAISTALGVVVALAVVSSSPMGSAGTGPGGGRGPAGIARAAHGVAPGARLASPALRKGDTKDAPVPSALAPVEKRLTDDPEVSDLAQEARLVTSARAALVAGDPARALVLVQATRRLSTRALEPEELGLEARALSALGRVDEAAATDLVLRRRYPDSALAR
jgi:hypothetical protein